MTLLSILGCNSIAVPLSSGFPASELRYILENSETLMLVSSTKFQSKAEEVVKEGLEKTLKLATVQKHLAGGKSTDQVQLDNLKDDAGGMMLYTSGTTSRPVCSLCPTKISAENIISRKACSFPIQCSQPKANPSCRPGSTLAPTTYYMFSHSTISTEP